MCITLHAAELKGTKLYAGEATRDGEYVHVIAYQNTAISKSPNAMILPIPSAVALTPANLIDTREFKTFLADISEATKIHSRGFSKNINFLEDEAIVVDVGSYSIVLATSASQVPAALVKVPLNKRPVVNEEILASYDTNYPGWPLVVCCWDGNIEAEPILLWYKPKTPSVLFAPALDSHDGHAPQKTEVKVDHFLSFGSTLRPGTKHDVRYEDSVPAILPKSVQGTRLQGRMPNGDFFVFLPKDPNVPVGTLAQRMFPGGVNPMHQVKLTEWMD